MDPYITYKDEKLYPQSVTELVSTNELTIKAICSNLGISWRDNFNNTLKSILEMNYSDISNGKIKEEYKSTANICKDKLYESILDKQLYGSDVLTLSEIIHYGDVDPLIVNHDKDGDITGLLFFNELVVLQHRDLMLKQSEVLGFEFVSKELKNKFDNCLRGLSYVRKVICNLGLIQDNELEEGILGKVIYERFEERFPYSKLELIIQEKKKLRNSFNYLDRLLDDLK